MRCPFRYRRKWTKFTFGVAGGFVDFVMAKDGVAEAWLEEHYPTCWAKFLHWLGVK